jgi:L-fucose isomerase-like protein
MELKREDIIKALEYCGTSYSCNEKCPFVPNTHKGSLGCSEELMLTALALIKELTEENERLREKADRHLENLKAVLEERDENTIKADTVRKMQERLMETAFSIPMCPSKIIYADNVNVIAKDMLEGDEGK